MFKVASPRVWLCTPYANEKIRGVPFNLSMLAAILMRSFRINWEMFEGEMLICKSLTALPKIFFEIIIYF